MGEVVPPIPEGAEEIARLRDDLNAIANASDCTVEFLQQFARDALIRGEARQVGVRESRPATSASRNVAPSGPPPAPEYPIDEWPIA